MSRGPEKKRMTPGSVRLRIWKLRRKAEEIPRDHEALHSEEDKLLLEVLEAIADGAYNPKQLAEAALKVRDLKFERHSA